MEGQRSITKRLNGVGLAKSIQSPISETGEFGLAVEFRRERYKAAPEARPRDGASKSREFTEGNWESKFWKRLSKRGKGLLN